MIYEQVSDDDATLSSISINNSPLIGFSPQTTFYTHILDVGDNSVPTILALVFQSSYTINNAQNISKITTIYVPMIILTLLILYHFNKAHTPWFGVMNLKMTVLFI